MKFEVLCPDCRGRGHFSVIEGDIFKGWQMCLRCSGYGWTDIKLTDEEVHDIIFKLFEQKHELISKYL